jgi:hypothetical protein
MEAISTNPMDSKRPPRNVMNNSRAINLVTGMKWKYSWEETIYKNLPKQK